MPRKPPPIKQPEAISGQRFDRLVAIDYRGHDNKWRCVCDCGNDSFRRLCDLRSNIRRGCRNSCGACIVRKPSHSTKGYKLARRAPDISGQKFGYLTALSIAQYTSSGTVWICSCDCGSGIISHRTLTELKQVKTPGCKDCETERRAEVHRTHGGAFMGKSRLYQRWQSMRSRCADMDNPHYGGKGIRVCAEWDDFRAFRRWSLENGYTDFLTIDRLNPSKGYSPHNCEWVTKEENSRRVSRPKYLDLGAV